MEPTEDFASMAGRTAQVIEMAAPRRRPRRKEEDLRALILEAARTEFLDKGYDGATTRGIATRAEVSESLLFRYFGAKADLLEAVALTPFIALFEKFYAHHGAADSMAQHRASSAAFVEVLTSYLRSNRNLIARVLLGEGERAESSAGFAMLQDYFARSVLQVRRLHGKLDSPGATDTEMAVRLGFGMVLAAVLFSDWLFAEEPDHQALTRTLAAYLERFIVA